MPEVAVLGRLAFAVVIAGGACEFGIVRINTDLIPIRFCALIIYTREAGAKQKRTFANGNHAIGDGDARETGAMVKRIFADRGHTIGDGDARNA